MEEFLKEKVQSKKRPDTIRNLKGRIQKFIGLFPSRNVADILPDHIREYIHRPTNSARGAVNDRAVLSNFFTWASSKEKKYCAANPILGVNEIRVDGQTPETLSLPMVSKLLEVASDYKKGILLPNVALGLFAGLRPRSELHRITWDLIDLNERELEIGTWAKKRQKRFVALSDNCVEWLLPYAKKIGKIVPEKNWRRDWDKVRELAGFRPERTSDETAKNLPVWVPDYMRHTALSHHYVLHGEDKTASWAGTSPSVLVSNYRKPTKNKDSEIFWNIRPGDAGKVIQLQTAVA